MILIESDTNTTCIDQRQCAVICLEDRKWHQYYGAPCYLVLLTSLKFDKLSSWTIFWTTGFTQVNACILTSVWLWWSYSPNHCLVDIDKEYNLFCVYINNRAPSPWAMFLLNKVKKISHLFSHKNSKNEKNQSWETVYHWLWDGWKSIWEVVDRCKPQRFWESCAAWFCKPRFHSWAGRKNLLSQGWIQPCPNVGF